MMVSVNLLKKKVYELESEAKEILKAGIEVLEAAEYCDDYLPRPGYKTPEGYPPAKLTISPGIPCAGFTARSVDSGI